MLRNEELRRAALGYLLLSAAAAAAGFWLDVRCGVLVLCFSAAAGLCFWRTAQQRYRRLAEMAGQIDRILHGEEELTFSQYSEGELAILQSEVNKMTLRIREQNAALRREKTYLADSMADIAHQLRTPLTALNLLLPLLRKEQEEARRRALLREQEALLTQMDQLVTSLLKLARMDAGVVELHPEPVTVEQLVRQAARPLEILLELHDITLNRDIPPEASLCVDPVWIAEALQNLLKNCAEHTPDGGKIDIICKDNPLYTEIVLHDSGSGFAPEDLPHLFERFYRGSTDNSTGYGIGLALCRSIVLRQGGTILAKNHPQGGAMFQLRFEKQPQK